MRSNKNAVHRTNLEWVWDLASNILEYDLGLNLTWNRQKSYKSMVRYSIGYKGLRYQLGVRYSENTI